MNQYIKAMRSYVDFSGRASRSDYWLFSLFFWIFYSAAVVIDYAFNLFNEETGFGPLSALVLLAHIVPGIALLVRRVHDTGHGGWWTVLMFVPVINLIAALYFLFKGSQPSPNIYGPNPFDVNQNYVTEAKGDHPSRGAEIDQLARLAEMRSAGAITEEEFNQMKRRLLAQSI